MKISDPKLKWSLALLAFAHMILAIDFNIVYVALPLIGKGFGFSPQTLQWVVSGYIITFGGFLLLGGRASDLLGRRNVFVFALFLFAGASLLGGLATSQLTLVVARMLQGLGGALIFPSTIALINSLFVAGEQRNGALAVWSMAGSSGLALGSIMGGLLTSVFGWASIFYFNVPLAGIAAILALKMMPKDILSTEKKNFDLPGALTATGGICLLVYVLVQAPEAGWLSPGVWPQAIAAIILLFSFFIIESKSAQPLMPLCLLGNPNLRLAMFMTFIFMGSFLSIPYFLTELFQTAFGYSALVTGLAFLLPCLLVGVGAKISGILLNKVGPKQTLLIGFFMGGLGMAVLSLGVFKNAGYINLLPGILLLYIAQGIVFSPFWVIAARGIKETEQGVASAMASTTFQVGGAIGLAILVAISNSVSAEPGTSSIALNFAGVRIALYSAAALAVIGGLAALMIKKEEKSESLNDQHLYELEKEQMSL